MGYLTRIFFAFVFVLITFGSAVAQDGTEFKGISITDFKLLKVTPEKAPEINLGEIKETKELTKAVVKSDLVQNKQTKKTESFVKPEKTVIKKKELKPQVVEQQQTAKTVKNTLIQNKKNTGTVASLENNKNEQVNPPVTSNEPKDTSFDKQNYVDSLNNYLDGVEPAQTSSPESKMDYNDYFVKPAVSLAIVLFLIMIAAWIYSKFRGGSTLGFLGTVDKDLNKFNVLSSSSLGQGKVIHLVEINGKQLVVGSTNNNINLLTEISPEDLEKLQQQAKRESVHTDPVLKEGKTGEELDDIDPDSYSIGYADIYKEYLDKENKD